MPILRPFAMPVVIVYHCSCNLLMVDFDSFDTGLNNSRNLPACNLLRVVDHDDLSYTDLLSDPAFPLPDRFSVGGEVKS
jgi:hypothetical protein